MVEVLTDSEHNYSLRIPNTTPRGQPVEILKDQREGTHRVHAQSPDDSELYFEIVSAPGLMNHEQAVAEQQAYLSSQSSDAAITAATQSVVRSFSATEFSYQGTLGGRWKVRRFIFLDSAIRTYRIVYDPRSTLNEQILDSLVIHGGGFARANVK
jgi:hypothetical protein